jgi:hypothetical protein
MDYELRHVDSLKIPTTKCPRTPRRQNTTSTTSSPRENWLSKTIQRLRERLAGHTSSSTSRDSNDGFDLQKLRRVPRSEEVLLVDQVEDDWWSDIRERVEADRRYQRVDLCYSCRRSGRAAVHGYAVAAAMSLR